MKLTIHQCSYYHLFPLTLKGWSCYLILQIGKLRFKFDWGHTAREWENQDSWGLFASHPTGFWLRGLPLGTLYVLYSMPTQKSSLLPTAQHRPPLPILQMRS